jgi:FKBP-type peptidyl-prolyl cis-trans isomerase
MSKRIVMLSSIAASVMAGVLLAAEPETKSAATQPATATAPADAPKQETRPDGLKIDFVAPGEATAKNGDIVWVHYTGKLENGTVFDTSLERHEPIQFQLGKGGVIKGWDEGILGMKIGEKRKLTIPSELGYGAAGSPPKIPANATLIFDVELIGIARPPAE